jgi:hypothetical protein
MLNPGLTTGPRRRSAFAALLSPTLTLACALAPAMPVQASNDRAASPRDAAVDDDIHPGDDFFSHANGAWLKTTEIPAGLGAVIRPIAIQVLRRFNRSLSFASPAMPVNTRLRQGAVTPRHCSLLSLRLNTRPGSPRAPRPGR